MMKNIAMILVLGFVAAFLFATPSYAANQALAQAIEQYARAIQVGPAHGPGCGNGFLDIYGDCWECPSGYRHDSIFLLPTDPKVCKKKRHRTNRHGIKMKSCFERGGFGPGSDGNCYRCPKGWKHDAGKLANQKGVCYQVTPDKYAAAKPTKGNLFCDRGQFADITGGGTCWKCPPDYPARTTHAVTSAKACSPAACGGKGERPCLLTERFPSCDKGLLENPLSNTCVDLNKAVCSDVVNAIFKNRAVAGLKALASEVQNLMAVKEQNLKDPQRKSDFLDYANRSIGPHQDKIPELRRLQARLSDPANSQRLEKLFSAQTLCNSSRQELLGQLDELGLIPHFMQQQATHAVPFAFVASAHAAEAPPNESYTLPLHWYGIQTSVELAFAFGGQVGVLIAIPSKASYSPQLLWFYGGRYVTNSASVGIVREYLLFPYGVDSEDFRGGAWDIGVGGGTGLTGNFDVIFTGKQFMGFGGGPGLGGGIPLPGDLSVSYSYSELLHTFK